MPVPRCTQRWHTGVILTRRKPATLRKLHSRLQGHPDPKRLPGVDAASGSLGQGLSIAVGMALAARLDAKDYRVYAVIGDGEQNEGQIWEAAMSAGHYGLNNLIAIIDQNGLQIDGSTKCVMNTWPLAEKWHSFGWRVIETDGHDFDKLLPALSEARLSQDRPVALICKTIKGKGVSFMENIASWHGAVPDAAQYAQAMRELERVL